MPKAIKPKAEPAPIEQPIRTVDYQGTIHYRLHGVSHREDGPAIEYANGRKDWMIKGRHHRLDGPAVITEHGDQYWMVNGIYHREEGPALHYHNGRKNYYLNNVSYNEKRFYEMVKDIRSRRALEALEKFSDKYADGKEAAKAGAAVMKFLQGECDHTFHTKNKECELCDSHTL